MSDGVRGLNEDERKFSIELKPGRNEITLSNEGHDWIEISAYYFKFNLEAGSSISVRRLISDNQQLALVQNTRFGEVYNKIFDGAVGITASVFTGVFNTVFSFVISVYVLAQKERIGAFVKRVVDAFIPEKATKVIYHVASRTQESFSRFIGGQLIEAVILGVLCFIGMLIFRIPNALIISVLISVMSLVPVVGATIGVVVGFLLIVITDPLKAVFFVIFFLILQQLEGNLIYPKVVGKAVGLPGVLVVSAVLVGGNIGGVLGTLIAVPTCAVLYVLLKELVEYVNNKKVLKKDVSEE